MLHIPSALAAALLSLLPLGACGSQAPATVSSETAPAAPTSQGRTPVPVQSEPTGGISCGFVESDPVPPSAVQLLRQARLTSPELAEALAVATDGLLVRQAPDGAWTSEGSLSDQGEVSATGLALLVLLGQGETPDSGPHKDAIARAIRWLRQSQDPDSGRLGKRAGRDGLFDQALGTLALVDAYSSTKSPLLKRTCRGALKAVVAHSHAAGGWRVDPERPTPDDVLLTAWAVSALVTARDARLDIPQAALEGAHTYLESITDPNTGLVDCLPARAGSAPVPRQRAMTAAALFSRFQISELDPATSPGIASALLELAAAPAVQGDLEALFFTANALFQAGGAPWRAAEPVLRAHLESLPVSPAPIGRGAIERAALMALAQEIDFRLPRRSEVLAAR